MIMYLFDSVPRMLYILQWLVCVLMLRRLVQLVNYSLQLSNNHISYFYCVCVYLCIIIDIYLTQYV